jgi:serine/threonine protein phosphatase PrpC
MGHAINQDSHAFKPGLAFTVADGVGGGAWGEVASSTLTHHLVTLEHINEHKMELAFADADQLISEKLQRLGPEPGAAVGIGLWPIDASGDQWLSAWVGDCRLLHLSIKAGKWLSQWRSMDQSYANLNVLPPSGVHVHSPANMVGCGMAFSPSQQRLTWALGDRMVLASDGFWNSVDSQFIADHMNQNPTVFAVDIAQQFCQVAQLRGSRDDITVMVVERLKA